MTERTWYDDTADLNQTCKTLRCSQCNRVADAPAYGDQTLSTTCNSCSNGDA